MDEIRYLISDASKKVDVETHVLRYWEEELGLSIPRNEMGHRYYTEFHIRLFCQVKKLKDKGYQLKVIKSALQQVMEKNQGVLEAANVLERDMSRTLQENQYLGFLHTFSLDNPSGEKVVQDGGEADAAAEDAAAFGTQLTDYNRLEPESSISQPPQTNPDPFTQSKPTGRDSQEGQISQTNQGCEIGPINQAGQANPINSDDPFEQIYRESTSDETGLSDRPNQSNQLVQSIQLLQTAENQNLEYEVPKEDQEESEKKNQEIGEKDGQAEMKNRRRDRKKPSAWERRNGRVADIGEKGAANKVMSGMWQDDTGESMEDDITEGRLEDSLLKTGAEDSEAESAESTEIESAEAEWGEMGLEENRWENNVITEEMAREMLRLIDARRRAGNESGTSGENQIDGNEARTEVRSERKGERKNERKSDGKGERDAERKREEANMDRIESENRNETERTAEARRQDAREATALAESSSSKTGEQAGLAVMTQDEKMEQFQMIMNHIIERALAVNNEKLSRDISGLVNRKISEELEDLMRIRDEREEERYRQIDEIIRGCQRDSQGKAEAAATRIPFFKRKRFGRNGKHL